jgi:hypothetical protein
MRKLMHYTTYRMKLRLKKKLSNSISDKREDWRVGLRGKRKKDYIQQWRIDASGNNHCVEQRGKNQKPKGEEGLVRRKAKIIGWA